MQITDPYNEMRKIITDRFNGEHVSNGWIKMRELDATFNVLANTKKAFFNAEFPGSFVLAANHIVATGTTAPPVEEVAEADKKVWGGGHPGRKLDWVGASYLPRSAVTDNTDSSILEDRYSLYKANQPRWLMDDKNDGDARSLDNIMDYKKKLPNGVDLYTHDAGIDVSDDYNNQELHNTKLHIGCALAGFATLRQGGNFIAKQYTYFETINWNLIIMYATAFEKFYIVKPLTSRATNSEIYLVGIGFTEFKYFDLLAEKLTNFNMNPFIPQDAVPVVCASAMLALYEASRRIFDRTATLITAAMLLYPLTRYDQSIYNELRSSHNFVCDVWLKRFPIKSIDDKDKLCPKQEYNNGPHHGNKHSKQHHGDKHSKPRNGNNYKQNFKRF
jgi:hypothetical protein